MISPLLVVELLGWIFVWFAALLPGSSRLELWDRLPKAAPAASRADRGLLPAERALVERYVEAVRAARSARDEVAAWRAVEAFVAASAAFPELDAAREKAGCQLAGHFAATDRSAEAVAVLNSLLPAGRFEREPSLSQWSTTLQLANLHVVLGQEAEARAALHKFPRPQRGGMRSEMDPTMLARRCEVLVRLDDRDAARLLYLSGTPRVDDAAVIGRYLTAGSVVAAWVGGGGHAAEELNFRITLLEKYPARVGAVHLRNARAAAERAGREDVVAALNRRLREEFPKAFYTPQHYDLESQRAMNTGRGLEAAESLESLLEHPEASLKQRETARARLRMLGFSPDPEGAHTIAPEPDPRFPRAEAGTGMPE